jgi:hypothetical protein
MPVGAEGSALDAIFPKPELTDPGPACRYIVVCIQALLLKLCVLAHGWCIASVAEVAQRDEFDCTLICH